MCDKEHLTDQEIAICAEAISSNKWKIVPEQWRSHLATCDECAGQLLAVSQIIDQQIDDNRELSPRVVKFRYRALAAAAVVVLLSTVYFLVQYNNSFDNNSVAYNTDSVINMGNASTIDSVFETSTLINEKKTVTTNNISNDKKVPVQKTENKTVEIKQQQNLIAYAPDNNMEKLVERFNNGALRGDNVIVKTNTEFEAVAGNVVVMWENPGNEELLIEVYNNIGNKLFETKTNGQFYNINAVKKPGLYYWKLISQDYDLLFCGKFKIVEALN